jgi:hypothetical protein
MATVNKDFKIKSGLIVEGTTATVNGYDILTKKQGDQDYIVSLIGGTATDANTANAIVKRDANGAFAAGAITATAVYVGGSTANGMDVISGNTEIGSDNGIVLNAGDDIALNSGNGDIILNPDGGAYLFSVSANNEISTKGYVDGEISTVLSTAEGYANAVASDLSDHELANSSVHGVTGNVVGTSDTQDLSNKRFIDTTYFTDGVTVSNEGQIAVLSPSHEFEVKANVGPLGLKSYNDDIVFTPGSGKDVKWGSDVVATQTYADSAAGNALADANEYTDNSVAALVDSAPALLDTLNELAQAIASNPNYATDMANNLAQKQNVLTEGNGIVIDANNVIYVPTYLGSGLNVTPSEVEIDRSTVDSWYDAAGTAAGLAGNYDASGSAATAESNANDYTDNAISLLSTSDIEEGSNEYFTDSRAKESAADLLTGASLTNITITGTGAGLTITAENGVGDSTTDDLDEGALNLYFTTQRAVDAIDVADITPNSVEINNYRKEEATQQYVASASTTYVHSLSGMYKSAKYLVRVVGDVSGTEHSQISEILMTVDGNGNIAITEYGTIYTSVDPLATFSATLSNIGSNPTLTATTAVNGCEVIAAATMLSWAD